MREAWGYWMTSVIKDIDDRFTPEFYQQTFDTIMTFVKHTWVLRYPDQQQLPQQQQQQQQQPFPQSVRQPFPVQQMATDNLQPFTPQQFPVQQQPYMQQQSYMQQQPRTSIVQIPPVIPPTSSSSQEPSVTWCSSPVAGPSGAQTKSRPPDSSVASLGLTDLMSNMSADFTCATLSPFDLTEPKQ